MPKESPSARIHFFKFLEANLLEEIVIRMNSSARSTSDRNEANKPLKELVLGRTIIVAINNIAGITFFHFFETINALMINGIITARNAPRERGSLKVAFKVFCNSLKGVFPKPLSLMS
jgi:hypothetical protein